MVLLYQINFELQYLKGQPAVCAGKLTYLIIFDAIIRK